MITCPEEGGFSRIKSHSVRQRLSGIAEFDIDIGASEEEIKNFLLLSAFTIFPDRWLIVFSEAMSSADDGRNWRAGRL